MNSFHICRMSSRGFGSPASGRKGSPSSVGGGFGPPGPEGDSIAINLCRTCTFAHFLDMLLSSEISSTLTCLLSTLAHLSIPSSSGVSLARLFSALARLSTPLSSEVSLAHQSSTLARLSTPLSSEISFARLSSTLAHLSTLSFSERLSPLTRLSLASRARRSAASLYLHSIFQILRSHPLPESLRKSSSRHANRSTFRTPLKWKILYLFIYWYNQRQTYSESETITNFVNCVSSAAVIPYARPCSKAINSAV